MKKIAVLASSLILIATSNSALAFETSAKQAIIVDYDTQQVLFEKNANEKMPTSSMSKVITAYAVMKEIKEGNITLDDKFRVSEKAWKKGGSKMFVEVGKDVRVEDLLRGVIIQSGNDATIVLAEGIAGTEDQFAVYLNKLAEQMGMDNSNFMNASGWPDENHYSTARDLATLGRHIITDFPEYYGIYSETEFTFNGITQQNRNPLLYMDIGADGIKTGHTEIAGYGLMASAKNDKTGRRVVVVFNGTDSKKARSEEAEKLVSYGLNGFKNQVFIDKDEDEYKVPVLFGQKEHVLAQASEDLILTIEKLSEDDYTSKFTPKPSLEAPVTKGTQIGMIEVFKKGKSFKTIQVIAKEDVAELGTFKKWIAKAKHKFANRDK